MPVDATERPSPALLTLLGVLVIVGLLSMGRILIDAWAMWQDGIRVPVLIVPGLLLVSGSLTWALGSIILQEAHPRIPSARDGEIVLQGPTSLRRASTAGLIGLALLGVGSVVFVVTRGVRTDEVPMTTYRWLLLVGFVALLLALSLVLVFLWRVVRGRFVANRRGLSWDRPFKRGRIEVPWGDIERIEPRGRLLTTRLVVVTDRKLKPTAYNGPISKDATRRLVAEIERLRPN